METAYLVLYGELPTPAQLTDFSDEISHHMVPDERIREMFRIFPRRSHPMPVLSAAVTALGLFSQDTVGFTEDKLDAASRRLMAKMPTLAAYAYRHRRGLPYVYPDNDLSYSENFLSMLFKMTETKYDPDPRLAKALDVLFILHADHEQNCSASTARQVGSAETDPYCSLAAAAAALFCFGNHLTHPRHAVTNRTKGDKRRIGRLRQESSEGSLADARWPPEHHRVDDATRQRLAQWHADREQVSLADIFFERPGTQPRGERFGDTRGEECRRCVHALGRLARVARHSARSRSSRAAAASSASRSSGAAGGLAGARQTAGGALSRTVTPSALSRAGHTSRRA